ADDISVGMARRTSYIPIAGYAGRRRGATCCARSADSGWFRETSQCAYSRAQHAAPLQNSGTKPFIGMRANSNRKTRFGTYRFVLAFKAVPTERPKDATHVQDRRTSSAGFD